MADLLKALLAHPLTRGLPVDDPRVTALRREIIRSKPFLRKIYEEWYDWLAASIPPGGGRVLELGSGAGFFKERLPEAVASEVFFLPGMDLALDGCALPFAAGSLRAVVMTDVFHHIPDVGAFLTEAGRSVRPGGVVAMLEPWPTALSRTILARLHPEPLAKDAPEWRLPQGGPLSNANQALPWIVFERDRGRFERERPEWAVEAVEPCMPFRYLVSGGVGMRSLMPGWAHGLWRGLENWFAPWSDRLGMFARIRLRRR